MKRFVLAEGSIVLAGRDRNGFPASKSDRHSGPSRNAKMLEFIIEGSQNPKVSIPTLQITGVGVDSSNKVTLYTTGGFTFILAELYPTVRDRIRKAVDPKF